MKNLTLSPRAEKAWSILEEGGYFRHALESNHFTGREQFKTRLYNKDRQVVKNIGIKTRFELEDAGLLQTRPCPTSSTWPSEYVAARG